MKTQFRDFEDFWQEFSARQAVVLKRLEAVTVVIAGKPMVEREEAIVALQEYLGHWDRFLESIAAKVVAALGDDVPPLVVDEARQRILAGRQGARERLRPLFDAHEIQKH